MKQKENPKGSIIKPLLQDLLNRKKDDKPNANAPETVKSPATQPPQPALYEDPGSGFNSNFTFPQD